VPARRAARKPLRVTYLAGDWGAPRSEGGVRLWDGFVPGAKAARGTWIMDVAMRRTVARGPRFLALLALGALLACDTPPSPPPPARARPVVARFTVVRGVVKVRPFGVVEWVTATVGMNVSARDKVSTWTGASAELAYADGLKLVLSESSYVEIATPLSTEVKGRVDFDAPARDRTVLQGDTARIEPVPDRSRKGSFEVADDGSALVRQRDGSLRVVSRKGAGGEVILQGGQEVAIGKDGATGAPRPLPDPPALLAPPDHASLLYPNPGRTPTVLLWSSVAGAKRYRVRLDVDPSFGSPRVDATVEGTTLTVDPLEPGTHYWQVESVGANGASGFPSAFSDFTIRAASSGPGPALVIERLELDGGVLRIEGRTDDATVAVTVNGETVDVDRGGRFREYVALPATGDRKVTVRARNAAGAETTVVKVLPADPR
jgi:hypothetical protein